MDMRYQLDINAKLLYYYNSLNAEKSLDYEAIADFFKKKEMEKH